MIVWSRRLSVPDGLVHLFEVRRTPGRWYVAEHFLARDDESEDWSLVEGADFADKASATHSARHMLSTVRTHYAEHA